MRQIPVEKIRNIGLMAHIDAGKTTTTERILYYTGVTYKIGEVDEGTAVMDWMDQEQERGITITAAATTCYWKDHRINVIDTPGHVDFTAEVERSLRVLDGMILVLCGVGGVEPQTEKVWFQASKYKIPRIAYVNKMDRIGSDVFDVIAQIEKKFSIKTLLLQYPLGREERFQGIIDLIEMKAFRYNGELPGTDFTVMEIPDEYREEAQRQREILLEKLSDSDMQIMELFLEKKTIPEELIHRAVRKETISLEALPVLMGSSFKNKAVQNLLDAIIAYLPSPLDKGDVVGTHPKTGEEQHRKLSDEEPMSATVFKIMSDPFVGQLVYFRVYSGSIKSPGHVYNSSKQSRLRILKLLKMHANKREEIGEVFSGDIAATVGLKDISTGDTLCDERHPIILDTIQFPEPVVSATIEPKMTSDHGKLDEVLKKLTIEDPTLRTYLDHNTGQLIISGMGELHLEVVQERIKREFAVLTKMGKPRVAYKETIRHNAIGEDVYNKQIAGKNQFGHVVLELNPFQGSEKLRFSVKIKEDLIPKRFHSMIEMGVKEAMDIGILAGYPVTNVEVSLVGGSSHDTDSHEIAYKVAAVNAFKAAFRKGDPVLLEPVMKVEIVTQEEYLGPVIEDLNSREGKIVHMDVKSNMHIIDAHVPMAAMFGYATSIRTLTQGRANYSMEFLSYNDMSSTKMADVLKSQLGIYAINL